MATDSTAFERIIAAFEKCCTKEGFALYQGHDTTQRVDIDEIRTEFEKYNTDLDNFFNMMFNIRDDWEFYDTTKQDREFDCDSEYNATED